MGGFNSIFNTCILMVKKVKENIDNLEISLFDKRDIKKVLKILSTSSKNYYVLYQEGKIKCFSCNQVIGPKSKKGKILGSVIFQKKGFRFSCQDLECYDKTLE